MANPDVPVSDSDSLSGLQWDMAQIDAPEAHAITGGSRTVLVGDVDTGLDFTHPDLAANFDNAANGNCSSGVPVPGNVVRWTKGTARIPRARSLRPPTARDRRGPPTCGSPGSSRATRPGSSSQRPSCARSSGWEGRVDVTNNSYFADPWLFNCVNDPEDAIWGPNSGRSPCAAELFTVVASEGNQFADLSHPSQVATSPVDTTTPSFREGTNSCSRDPVRAAGRGWGDRRRQRPAGERRLSEVVLFEVRHQDR